MAAVASDPARLVHRGLGRVELFDFPRTALAHLATLLARFAAEGRPRLSFHAPLPRSADFPGPGVACYFLADEDARREQSFGQLADTLDAARRFRADYVVTHLTYGPSDTRDPGRARALAARACARMAALARAHGVPIYIEFAAYTDAFHEPERFLEATAPYPELGICLDSGHAAIGAALRGRDYRRDVRTLAPYTRALHLWNTRGLDDYRVHGHRPLHPTQDPREGWVDIEYILATVLTHTPDAALVFEYPVATLTTEILAGYRWAESLATRLRRHTIDQGGGRA